MDNFGAKLKELRQREKLTMQELSEKLEISQGYLSQIESSDRMPHPKKIKQIAEFFNVPYGYLLTDNAIGLESYKEIEKLTIEKRDEKYVPYYVVVDKAIEEQITPEELEEAINFVRKFKNKTPST